jgi:hypothetical protein
MFSHVAREPGTHQCIGSRASDPASELQDLGGARAIAPTAINAEVPASAETICRSKCLVPQAESMMGESNA